MAAYTNTTMVADTTDVDGFMGENVSTNFTEAMEDLVGVYTEAYLCVLIKFNAVTNWADLDDVYKLMLSEYVARAIAVEGIKYDMSGYTSRIEAEDMINIHIYRMQQIENILLKISYSDFLKS
jgi:hypothetical protein